ncbi:MAG: conjugative transposon protein TraN [Pseudobacter sp.]|uniref:conjugative transposon protein TraN n=1 Tax=Pseudobacter sp. TaxID=2045420 RepID=UPI003F7F6209
MKKCVCFLWSLLLLAGVSPLSAQSSLGLGYKVRLIDPFRMTVSTNMTTNIVFPYQIKSVDRGSAVILAQKANGAENVLQIKAATEDFKESNLSVITADGQLFSFLINYAAVPSFLNLSFYKDSFCSPVQLEGNTMPEHELLMMSAAVKEQHTFLKRTVRNLQVRLTLRKIIYHQDMLWFSLSLDNQSLINYHPEYIKFFVQDRKRAKRTAIQQKELIPVFIDTLVPIVGDQKRTIVIGFPAFTISRNQEVRVMISERNGGRSLELNISPSLLGRARLLQL